MRGLVSDLAAKYIFFITDRSKMVHLILFCVSFFLCVWMVFS